MIVCVCVLQVKRGNSDLQSLQSCVSMVSEMETVYFEDIATTRPHFKAVRTICRSLQSVCSKNQANT